MVTCRLRKLMFLVACSLSLNVLHFFVIIITIILLLLLLLLLHYGISGLKGLHCLVNNPWEQATTSS